jgi:hypothetical protein
MHKGRKTNEYAWKVSAKESPDRNYNLDCKNPRQVKVENGDTEKLMWEYQKITRQLQAAQSDLKQELMAALGDRQVGFESPLDEEERLCNLIADSIRPRLSDILSLCWIKGLSK